MRQKRYSVRALAGNLFVRIGGGAWEPTEMVVDHDDRSVAFMDEASPGKLVRAAFEAGREAERMDLARRLRRRARARRRAS